MVNSCKRFAGPALACWAVGALCQPVWGQASFGQRPIYGQIPLPINPNPTIAPGVSLQQSAFNVQVLGRAYRNIPPYLLGYNPYPQFVNYGPAYGSSYFQPAVYNPYAPGYSAATPSTGHYYSSGGFTPYYGGNAYTGGYAVGGVDPLTGLSTGSGYGAGYYGAGDYTQQAELAALDSRKKLVDTLAYVRANETGFTPQQIDVVRRILERIQKMPTNQEIATGKSLNILLDDLIQLAALHVRSTAVMLDADALKRLNITGQPDGANLGLLRDHGRFDWPLVFDDKNIASVKEKIDVELYAQELLQQALNAKIDKNTARDLESSLHRLRESLRKNFKEVPLESFLEGLRFLDSFDAAVLAIEKGDAVLSLDFQQKFAAGGKTVQDLVDYMKTNGLRFAPANPGDERVYQILQTALAALSMGLHNQINTAAKE
jgi:hypothetical protein